MPQQQNRNPAQDMSCPTTWMVACQTIGGRRESDYPYGVAREMLEVKGDNQSSSSHHHHGEMINPCGDLSLDIAPLISRTTLVVTAE